MTRKKKSEKPAKHSASKIFAVYQETELALRRYLHRFTSSPHDVDDITQETILRALQAERLRKIQEPRAYLFMIARNLVRDELDRKSRSVLDFIEDFAPGTDKSEEPLPDDQVDSNQRMLLFWEAVASLPAQCQQVFVLKKVYGYSHKEISSKLGISISTTEKHAATGLKRCSDFMRAELSPGNNTSAGKVTFTTPLTKPVKRHD